MSSPLLRYVSSGDADLAVQVVGDGDLDLVVVHSWIGNIELVWELAEAARFFDALAGFSRLILFDKRGSGLSERAPRVATLEQRSDDVGVVMDAVGSERAAIFGWADAGAIAAHFSATHPERVHALVLGSFAAVAAHALDESALDDDMIATFTSAIENSWGDATLARVLAPSLADDERFLTWFRRWERMSATPRAAAAEFRWSLELDARAILPAIRVPTLVLQRRDNLLVHSPAARATAAAIPGARYVELPGADVIPVAGDSDAIVSEIQEFLTGHRARIDTDRVLATALFTDIVGSTERAQAIGDRAWRDLLDAHHRAIRASIARFGGLEIDTAGDGFFITFDGPARAVRCATAAREAVRELGIEIRAGLHTGEVEHRGNDVSGLAVHLAARVNGLADASEVLVTSTVKDLVLGSGIEFEDRGVHSLKGVPDEWRIYSVVG